ncbi:MAG: methylmalonyl Co-A mutase-associated GTPase MeaB [Chitinophagales bacterium]
MENLSAQQFFEGIRKGDTVLIARAITLLESAATQHREKALAILQLCLPYSGNSLRIGITGAPGVGKSSLIETLGKHIVAQGNKLAVLAIDPSSKKTKGSILGDKTRMQELAKYPEVFIRPTASGEHLGGVAAATRETILLLEAAGFNTILVETVGVGQSETAVHDITDVFLLLLLAGAGDELQGIKRGIMEMADIIVINKADGDNIPKSKIALGEVTRALHLFQEKNSGWITTVDLCSAATGAGVPELWDKLNAYKNFTAQNGYFADKRREQYLNWFHEYLNFAILERFSKNADFKQKLTTYTQKVENAEMLPPAAVQALLDGFFTS